MSSRDCNSCNNLLRRDGTSQKQRLFEEQQTDYILIDERSTLDLLQFTLKYAEKIQFWDVFNNRSGDWVAMMENRQASVYTEIANVDLDLLWTEFDTYYNEDVSALAITDPEVIDIVKGMVKETFNVASILDGWLELLDADLDLITELQNSIQRQAAPLMRNLVKYDKGGLTESGLPTNPTETLSDTEVDYDTLSDFWLVDVNSSNSDTTIFAEIIDIKRHFRVLFAGMLGVLEQMQLEAEGKFDEHLNNYAKHEPHFALFLAFIQLYKHAQDHINKLTGDHLDFYYRDVLQLEEKASRPDSVHVIFEPAKNVDQKKVDAGTALVAGKDDDGKKIIFETDEEIVINKAKIAKIRTLYLDRDLDSKYIQTMYSAEQANSLDGSGADLPSDGVWEPFGKTQVSDGALLDQTTMETARVGFAFASPELRLGDGFRIVTLTLGITPDSYEKVFGKSGAADTGTFQEFVEINLDVSENDFGELKEAYEEQLSNWLSFRLTGTEEWVEPDNTDNTDNEGSATITVSENEIVITFSISREKGAIVSYSADVHEGNYTTEWPILEILCDQTPKLSTVDFPSMAYEFLKDLQFNSVRIDCDVTGYSDLVIGNDSGELDAAKPYRPFTSNPQVGSNFYIGSQEVFSKKLSFLNVDLDWKGVPDSELMDYYRHYMQMEICQGKCSLDSIVQDNSHFTAHLKFLDDFGWKQLSKDSTTVPMYQSSGLALKQTRGTMISSPPSLFFLFALNLGQNTWDSPYYDYEMYDFDEIKDIQRGVLTSNYVNLFRSNTGDTDDDTNDARLPNSIYVESAENGDGSYRNNFNLLEDVGTYERSPYLNDVTTYTEGVKRGFIKLELVNDFFHAAYGKILTERLNRTNLFGSAVDAPNVPYTPELHKATLNYKSFYKWTYDDEFTWENRVEQFYHITPFGEIEVLPTNDEKSIEEESQEVYYSNQMLPKLFKDGQEIDEDGRKEDKVDIHTGRIVEIILEETSEGKLLIGIEDFEAPQSLSLLFQFKEGTEDNDLEVPTVQWSYQSNNQWVAFETSEIVNDTTNGLVNSGIINFSIPSEASSTSYLDTDGLLWLKADIAGDTEAFSDLIAIHAQAAVATYAESDENDPNRLSTEIAADEIAKFVDKDFEIKSISQPYASFDGRVKELSTQYYTRVAERLRHKQRGITIRDYEHLVLEEFPEIYKVKCINHTSKYSEYSPGNVSVVVIPYFKNQNEKNPFELKVSKAKLTKIDRFLVKLNSPFVDLDVRNPKYETIRVDFKVEFHIGYDRTYYEGKLNEEIKTFISPWAYGQEEDIIFGGKINRSLILNFIEEREYVDYVTDFVMWHKEDENRAEVNVFVAEGTTASSVIVTAQDHDIKEIE